MKEEGAVRIKFLGQTLILSPYKVLFWLEQRLLLISDVHLGKANHFRKSGIAVPATVHLSDQQRIDDLIKVYSPVRIVFLGDLFHSEHNLNWPIFNAWLEEQKDIQFILVRGNHDILPAAIYEDSVMILMDCLNLDPFSFTHEQIETPGYNISGHVHPAIKLKGNARQSMRLPCFYFSENNALMPAFGAFTGFVKISVKRKDKVFALTQNKVIAIS